MFGSGIQTASTDGEEQLFINLGRALWRHRVLLAVVALASGVVGLAASYLFDVRYTAYAQVMIDTRVANDPGFGPAISGIPTSLTALESELEVLRSHDLVEMVVNRYDLTQDTEFVSVEETATPLFSKQKVREVVFSALALIGVSPTGAENGAADDLAIEAEDPITTVAVRNVVDAREIQQVGEVSAVYSIAFTSRSSRKAALLANGLAEEYINRQIEDKLRSLERSQQWLTDRTSEVQQRLAELNVALENHLLDAPYSAADLQNLNARKATLQDELGAMMARKERADALIDSVRELKDDDPKAAVALIELPSMQLTQAVVNGTEAALRNALEDELERLVADQEQLDARIDSITGDQQTVTGQLIDQAAHDAETRQLENEIRVNEAIYQDFVSQLSRRTQQDQFLDPDSRIISYARPPEYPSEPRRTRMAAIMALLALIVAAGVVCLRELLQTKMRTIQELEAGTGLPVVGIIPAIPRSKTPLEIIRTHAGELKPSTIAFARKLYASVVAEQDHQPKGSSLQTRLGEHGKTVRQRRRGADVPALSAERGQVIACVGSLPGEGNSTLSLLIAAAGGFAGEKVLLLDCDFWKATYRGLGRTDAGKYIEAVFSHERSSSVITRSDHLGIDVIVAPQGLSDPTALLTSSEFKRFVGHLAENYDRVIIDCAPILSHIDIVPVCRVANLVLLSARWNSTARGAVTTALKVLSDIGVTPDAVVATRVKLRRASVYGDQIFAYVQELEA